MASKAQEGPQYKIISEQEWIEGQQGPRRKLLREQPGLFRKHLEKQKPAPHPPQGAKKRKGKITQGRDDPSEERLMVMAKTTL